MTFVPGISKLSQLEIDAVSAIATSLDAKSDAEAIRFCNTFAVNILGSIFNDSGITANKAATILSNIADTYLDRCAEIIQDSNLSVSKVASILASANITADKVASILEEKDAAGNYYLSASRGGQIFGDDGITMDRIELICSSANMTADRSQAFLYEDTAGFMKILAKYIEGSSDLTVSLPTTLSGTLIYNNIVIDSGVTLQLDDVADDDPCLVFCNSLTNNGTILPINGGNGGSGMAGGDGGDGGGGFRIFALQAITNNDLISADGENGQAPTGCGEDDGHRGGYGQIDYVTGDGVSGGKGGIGAFVNYWTGAMTGCASSYSKSAGEFGGSGGNGHIEDGGGNCDGGKSRKYSYGYASANVLALQYQKVMVDKWLTSIGKTPTTPTALYAIHGGGGGEGGLGHCISAGNLSGGGGGGGSGGVVICVCDTFSNTDTISLNAGNGGDCGDCGSYDCGGGGAGGGLFYALYIAAVTLGTINKAKGVGGSGDVDCMYSGNDCQCAGSDGADGVSKGYQITI